jgi:hypothetical protein
MENDMANIKVRPRPLPTGQADNPLSAVDEALAGVEQVDGSDAGKDILEALGDFQEHTLDALTKIQHHLDAPEEPVVMPELVVDESLLPDHVRAEREAGRAAVEAARNRHALEIEAGREAQRANAARIAAQKSE